MLDQSEHFQQTYIIGCYKHKYIIGYQQTYIIGNYKRLQVVQVFFIVWYVLE